MTEGELQNQLVSLSNSWLQEIYNLYQTLLCGQIVTVQDIGGSIHNSCLEPRVRIYTIHLDSKLCHAIIQAIK